LAEAREQWVAVFDRDRADLGPAHAADLAAREAACYAQRRPLDQVLAELREAWTAEQRCLDRLAIQEPLCDALPAVVALETDDAGSLLALEGGHRQAAIDAEHAQQQAGASGAVGTARADRIRETLLARWDAERNAANQAVRTVLDGPGRLGLRRAAVARAGQQLTDWADRWRAHIPDLPTASGRIAQVARFVDRLALEAAFEAAARRDAEHAHPEHAALRAAAEAAQHAHEEARGSLTEACRRHGQRLADFRAVAWPPDPAGRLAEIERDIAAIHRQLTDAQAHIARLTAELAILTQPPDRLTQERDAWRAQRIADRGKRDLTISRPTDPTPGLPVPQPLQHGSPAGGRGAAPSPGR
jgi:exodeoxyribonuclease V alpha subunit